MGADAHGKAVRKAVRKNAARQSALPSAAHAPRTPQLEAFVRFFVGTHNVDMTYDDDMASVARKNLLSVSGFWFDCATSIPWAYMDLRVYLVSPHA